MKLVVALGGNALAPRGSATPAELRATLAPAVRELAALVRDHALVVTHGNGPQVGWLADLSRAAGESVGLDVLGAESEGLLGYWIEQELANALPEREVATLLTRVEVDPQDPAFQHPTKPIGPVLSVVEADRLRARGQRCAPDRGGWRRVVASPAPRRVLELPTIALLVRAGVLVICAGGGGIPVVRTESGHRGVEAVIDKDRAAELLASALGFDGLLLLTDVPAVFADWPGRARPVRRLSFADSNALLLDPGTMGPKVEAARRFVAAGRRAWIGALADARAILRGEAGTEVVGPELADASRGGAR
jgi:carbamate kinase